MYQETNVCSLTLFLQRFNPGILYKKFKKDSAKVGTAWYKYSADKLILKLMILCVSSRRSYCVTLHVTVLFENLIFVGNWGYTVKMLNFLCCEIAQL